MQVNLIKAALLPLCAVAMLTPATASAADALASDSLTLEPRTYMGKTVMAAEPDFSIQKPSWWSQVRATGSIQTEFLIPQEDSKIGTGSYEKDVLNNTYFDFTVNAPYISVGARFEWAKWPLPGYTDPGFDGWGVPYIWATGRYKWLQVTAGDFYEQFGSGLILRLYQERSLGIDNAIRGGRIKLNPTRGLNITMLGGKQRRYWEHNASWLWGADAEWSINESVKGFGKDYGLTIGASYVGRHMKDEVIMVPPALDNRLNLPRNVAAFDGRVKVRLHDFNILAEFATKNNDPTSDNNYTYRRGSAVLLSASYAAKGFSAFLQAKRSDNMAFRSLRTVPGTGISSFVNHLPAFTMTQTYALAAMYPYATQNDGEWAFQGEVRYLFKKGTPLGGKYGTNIRLSGSYISALDRDVPPGMDPLKPAVGTDNYGTPFWKIGSLNYADFNLEINKKFSRKLQFTLFYLFQKYNQQVVEGHGGMVTANTIILEGQWKMAKKTQLRWELQYLQTKQDKGDWLSALVEVSFAPHWMVTLTDTYNAGETNINYYNAMVTYNLKANRFTFGYGRTRAGYDCSGGVCRWVPATKGFSLTYNYTF